MCAQSLVVSVSIEWNLSLPNPVRVKTTTTLTGKHARRPYEGGIVCGDVVAYGWIDSVLEFKK